MCGGKWSSAIRKNREGLPPLKNHYDKDFVKQIREFLPFLREARFIGGEPFLINLYYDIWEAITESSQQPLPEYKATVTPSSAA